MLSTLFALLIAFSVAVSITVIFFVFVSSCSADVGLRKLDGHSCARSSSLSGLFTQVGNSSLRHGSFCFINLRLTIRLRRINAE